jgi:hypothetical protein
MMNSKMAARGRKQKYVSCSEILERRWRHNLQAKPPRRDKTLTPPQLQQAQRISTSTLKGENRRAPGSPDACNQTTWEDTDKVS